MPRYEVQHLYSSFSGSQGAPWLKGATVDLDEARAAWINVDSPGTLVLVPEEPEPEAEPDQAEQDDADTASEPATAEAEKPGRNRQHRPNRTRS